MDFDKSYSFNLCFDELNLTKDIIAESIGYPNGTIPHSVIDIIEHQILKAKSFCSIKAGYLVCMNYTFSYSKDKFTLNGKTFNTGKIIGSQLKNSENVILFAASAGNYFEVESKKEFDCGNSLEGLIIDTIGSELVEKAGAWIEQKLRDFFTNEGINLTNRYSPGYCDWNVEEQFKLFSFLPNNFCEISLTETAMMIPLKSISGVMGYGKNVKNTEYPCNACGMEYCYKRKVTSKEIK